LKDFLKGSLSAGTGLEPMYSVKVILQLKLKNAIYALA